MQVPVNIGQLQIRIRARPQALPLGNRTPYLHALPKGKVACILFLHRTRYQRTILTGIARSAELSPYGARARKG